MDLQEAWQTLRRQLDEIADDPIETAGGFLTPASRHRLEVRLGLPHDCTIELYGHALTIAVPIRRGRSHGP